MIHVNPHTHALIWGLLISILDTGWVIYSLLGGEIVLTIMVALSIILAGGTIIFIERYTRN